jgi:lysophospholipase L1-like esterase
MKRRTALAGAFAAAALPARAAAPQKPRTVLAATPLSRTDLPWWRARHEAKLEELRTKRPTLVFYGDSITQQYERHGPPDWQDFAPVWERWYGKRNAVNLGYTGDTTAHLLWRIENGEAAGIAPKAAVVLIGANNLGRVHWSAEDTVAGIDAIIRALHRHLPDTRILLLGILPSDRSEWATETTVAVNKALAGRYGKGADVAFLDIGPTFMRNGRIDHGLFYDPLLTPPQPALHPTAQGQARMAEAIEPTLAALLGERRPG